MALVPMVVAMAASWFVYVPIHELLHALGCVVAGGTISTLEISPRYGGAILERYFDFVVAGGEYAGRLSGFDTHGSDLIYLATDFGPYVLSVFIGVPLLRICAGRRRPWLFGMAVVVGLAPFYNIPGDYFEMGSITLTRAVTIIQGGKSSLAFSGIRSDDVFTLVANIFTQAAAMGGAGGLGACVVLLLLVTLSLVVDILLAFLTYSAGAVVATALLPAVVASSRRRKPPGD